MIRADSISFRLSLFFALHPGAELTTAMIERQFHMTRAAQKLAKPVRLGLFTRRHGPGSTNSRVSHYTAGPVLLELVASLSQPTGAIPTQRASARVQDAATERVAAARPPRQQGA